MQIGDEVTEVIEVIYNEAFGDVEEDVKVGDQVEACGDYITSNAPSGPYPASPDGAILHWVHMASGSGHPNGYLRINGMLYGDEQPNDRGPKHGGGHGSNQGQNNDNSPAKDIGQDQNQNNDPGNNKNQGQNQHQGKHYPKHQGKHSRHN